MKKNTGIALSLLVSSALSFAEQTPEQVVLYQIGQKGAYCLSITPNEGGCISGTASDGEAINLMEFVKGKQVVFRNLSDAPHDMKFSGANAEELPPQAPQAADAIKQFQQEDQNKNRISCSFHGAQLEVGYKVLTGPGSAAQKGAEGDGHKEGADRAGVGTEGGQAGGAGGATAGRMGGEGTAGAGGSGGLKMTGLADVSQQVLAKGNAAEVEKLVSARPELMGALSTLRPMLAAELTPKLAAAGITIPPAGSAGAGLPGGAGGRGAAGGGVAGAGGASLAKGGSGELGNIKVNLAEGAENEDEEVAALDDRMVLPGGNAAVVGYRPTGLGGVLKKENGQGGRKIASLGPDSKDSLRTKLKPAVSRQKRDWLSVLKDGHTWLILILGAAVLWTARVAVAGTRSKKDQARPTKS
jgi:hypothetical protein